MVKRYHNFGILDLTIHDRRYERIRDSGIIVKKENQRKTDEE